MNKYKYLNLSKEEKKKELNRFYNTKRGKELRIRFKRIIIYAMMLIVMGVYFLIEAYINNKISGYIYSIILIIIGILFIISKEKIKIKQVNDFITKK